jgi:hypothetical protein
MYWETGAENREPVVGAITQALFLPLFVPDRGVLGGSPRWIAKIGVEAFPAVGNLW